MALLIDGYNLLHVSGIFGRGRGPGFLERSRNALLNSLASSLDEQERLCTTIVFDAKDAPPGLPRTVSHHGMTVHYAAEHEEADDLIEELIRAVSAPRNLTVVSSDRRLQRAAQRRKATPIDSHIWYTQLVQQRDQSCDVRDPTLVKPQSPLTDADVQAWVDEFGEFTVKPTETAVRPVELPEPVAEDRPASTDEKEKLFDDIGNPFPPGYADDVLDEEA